MIDFDLKDNFARNRIAVIMFFVLTAGVLFTFFQTIMTLLKIEEVLEKPMLMRFMYADELEGATNLLELSSGFTGLITLALAIVVIMWMFRAITNLRQLKYPTSYHPNW
ncbi:MAG: hypothetical protein AAF570_12070, partial [Bacteroidota bacterium]